MSEFLVTSDVSGGLIKSGHQTKRLLIGDAESVRPKLVAALERLGYHILNEQPLQAKRRANRKVIGKLNNSTVTMSVGLKTSSETVTIATFDYEVASASMYSGDHTTIEREVDALAAIVNRDSTSGVCPGCGTAQTSNSLFCRLCGAQMGFGEFAELEVLRLNNETRFGHRANITGTSLLISTLITGLALVFLGSGKGINAGWTILIMGQIAGYLTLLFGNYVVHRALNSKQSKAPIGELRLPLFDHLASPLPPIQVSVTEGTTQLLVDSQITGQLADIENDKLA